MFVAMITGDGFLLIHYHEMHECTGFKGKTASLVTEQGD